MGTREQLKYAQERIESSHKAKQIKIANETTTPPDKLPAKDFLAAVKSGKIKLHPETLENHADDVLDIGYARFNDVFDLSEYRKKPKIDEKERAKRLNALNTQYTKIMDELMLGDMQKALALVQEFAAKEF